MDPHNTSNESDCVDMLKNIDPRKDQEYVAEAVKSILCVLGARSASELSFRLNPDGRFVCLVDGEIAADGRFSFVSHDPDDCAGHA